MLPRPFEKTSSGIGFEIVRYCTECTVGEGGIEDPTDPRGHLRDCSPRYIDMAAAEQPPEPSIPTPPTTGEGILQEESGVLEEPPTPPQFDPTAPLQGGVLEQQPTSPPSAPGASPGVLEQLEQGEGFSTGFLEQQREQPPTEQGAAELSSPPATEGTQPATVEEDKSGPVCQEGLEFNEDLGYCVPTECPEGQVLDEEAGICVPEEPEVVEQEEPEQQSQPEEQDQQQQPLSEEESSEENSN
jgi:hypothetical protein